MRRFEPNASEGFFFFDLDTCLFLLFWDPFTFLFHSASMYKMRKMDLFFFVLEKMRIETLTSEFHIVDKEMQKFGVFAWNRQTMKFAPIKKNVATALYKLNTRRLEANKKKTTKEDFITQYFILHLPFPPF